MDPVYMIHDIVEANGKTIKENNLAIMHNIPIGTLVEAEWQEWLSKGACWSVKARLWVVAHGRDCDGTPLYSLSRWKEWPQPDCPWLAAYHAFLEGDLVPVEVTVDIEEGNNMPDWWQEDE